MARGSDDGDSGKIVLDADNNKKMGGSKREGMLVGKVHEVFLKSGMPPPPKDHRQAYTANVKNWIRHCEHLENGRIQMGYGIKELSENHVILTNGAKHKCDLLISCTGYKLIFPFLERKVLNSVERTVNGKEWLRLHKLTMHPEYPTLCFCGMINTNANEAGVWEMQGRYCLSVLTGNIPMPSHEEMELYCKSREARLNRMQPWYTRFIDYIRYTDELAEEIGCKPFLPELPEEWKTNPPANADVSGNPYLFNLWYGPVTLQHWRLNGHGTWDGAKDFIANVHKITNSKL